MAEDRVIKGDDWERVSIWRGRDGASSGGGLFERVPLRAEASSDGDLLGRGPPRD